MNDDKRRTQSLDSRRANIYRRISSVWDQLGDEFKASELYKLAGIKNVFANRILVASVLAESFNCTIVGDFTPRRRWKKGATRPALDIDPFAPVTYSGAGNAEINKRNLETLTVLPPMGYVTADDIEWMFYGSEK